MTSNKHKIQLTPEEKKARLANKKINNTNKNVLNLYFIFYSSSVYFS